MTVNKFDMVLACPMAERDLRRLGLPAGTCRLLISVIGDAQFEFARIFVEGFRAGPISVRAEGLFNTLRDVVSTLGPTASFDNEAVSVDSVEQLATVLKEWRAEELVIVPCSLRELAATIGPADSIFKLTPVGHTYRYSAVIERCGPVVNYSADHGSLECFGTEQQIMRLHSNTERPA